MLKECTGVYRGTRGSEAHKVWLFDLAHGNLDDRKIVRGFIGFYILNGADDRKVYDDMFFHTNYGQEEIKQAKEHLVMALEAAADGKLI